MIRTRSILRAASASLRPTLKHEVTPHKLFAMLTPTRRLMAILPGPEGDVAYAYTDVYLGTPIPGGTQKRRSFNLSHFQRELDLGGVVLISDATCEEANIEFAAAATVLGLPFCRWPVASEAELISGNNNSLDAALLNFCHYLLTLLTDSWPF